MTISRRTFVAGAAGAAAGLGATGVRGLTGPATADPRQVPSTANFGRALQSLPADRFDPWIEVDPSALAYNVSVLRELSGNRPIFAVVKNNGYGLGVVEVAKALEPMPEIVGFAVVKAQAALALKAAGITKPVLLMALFGDEDGAELVANGVQLALTSDDAAERVLRAQATAGRSAIVHAYLDTGMSRMGIPYHRALPWYRGLTEAGLQVESSFMGFTEEPDFDREQTRRFLEVADAVRGAGMSPGLLHAASSNGVFHLPEAHLDMVRPGISLYGAYPSDWEAERAMAQLRPAVRLRARIVRVERLRAGDSVSYGRNYVARRPTWIATIPAGHTDGVVRESVQGRRALIGERTYPFIGAVSASHSIIEVGEEQTVRVGDVVTLLGADHADIHPNAVSAATGRSVYDVLMHLNPGLPKVVV